MPAPDRSRLADLLARERARFADDHPRSAAEYASARAALFGGVPMTWMNKAAGGFPLYLDTAQGARVRDLDGRDYVDFALGDTGAMAGHSPAATVAAVREQLERGITVMMPTLDATWVGTELARRFGVARWSFALTATDANRWAIRLARAVTGRPKILVNSYCYHGTVDETLVKVDEHGAQVIREGNVGAAVDPTTTTRVVEYNDVAALERELSYGDVACVLMEPALTNIGIVLPEDGYLEAVRELCTQTGTLLIDDETHTISAGPGRRDAGVGPAAGPGHDRQGHRRRNPLRRLRNVHRARRPARVDGRPGPRRHGRRRRHARRQSGVDGGDARDAVAGAHRRRVAGDDRARRPVRRRRGRGRSPSTICRGRCRGSARASSTASAGPPRATAASLPPPRTNELEDYLHTYLANRGVLLTPFHNMALMSPATTAADVDRHTEVFTAAVEELLG